MLSRIVALGNWNRFTILELGPISKFVVSEGSKNDSDLGRREPGVLIEKPFCVVILLKSTACVGVEHWGLWQEDAFDDGEPED